MASPSILVLVGPTASGKTSSAIALAHAINGVIISADSRQVYAQLNVGTAKPQAAWSDKPHALMSSDIVGGIPHYFLNIQPVTEVYTLSQWHTDVYALLDSLTKQNKPIIVTGGTMLYIDSLIYNYTIPAIAPDIQFRKDLEKEDVTELYHELLGKDPEAQAFIEPHNKRRIIRALEVIQSTGKPFSEQRTRQDSPYTFTLVGLFPGWETLERNIRTRATAMIESGLLEETQKLRELYSPTLPLLQTMNYKQAGEVLDGTKSHTEALDEMVRVTMRYAHRQMSWWKKNPSIQWVSSPDEILSFKSFMTV